MQIIEVTSLFHKQEFLKFPVYLYKEDPNWIRPLDKDVEGVFDEKINKFFRKGKALRWLFFGDDKKLLVRVEELIIIKV